MSAIALRSFAELWGQESFDAVCVHADSAKEDLKSIRHLFSELSRIEEEYGRALKTLVPSIIGARAPQSKTLNAAWAHVAFALESSGQAHSTMAKKLAEEMVPALTRCKDDYKARAAILQVTHSRLVKDVKTKAEKHSQAHSEYMQQSLAVESKISKRVLAKRTGDLPNIEKTEKKLKAEMIVLEEYQRNYEKAFEALHEAQVQLQSQTKSMMQEFESFDRGRLDKSKEQLIQFQQLRQTAQNVDAESCVSYLKAIGICSTDEDIQHFVYSLLTSMQHHPTPHPPAPVQYEPLQSRSIAETRLSLMKSADADAPAISSRELEAANELISPGKVVASAQVQALVTSIASSTTAPVATRPRPPSIPAPQLPTARPTSLSSVMTSNPFFEKESVAPSAVQHAAQPSSDGHAPSVIDVGRALFAFHAETATDMEMLPNDKIEVYEKNEDGWYRGRNIRTNQVGMFPSNYTVLSMELPLTPAAPPLQFTEMFKQQLQSMTASGNCDPAVLVANTIISTKKSGHTRAHSAQARLQSGTTPVPAMEVVHEESESNCNDGADSVSIVPSDHDVVALFDFAGDSSSAGEFLTVRAGDLVHINAVVNGEWLLGHVKSKPSMVGLIPANYAQKPASESS